jgi:spore coat polysaccharide biosynthesis protein SpsF
MATLAGKTMLERIIERVQSARLVDQLVIATTTLQEDDPIALIAENSRSNWFRGAEIDCLDRYYQAASYYCADVVVRLTGDNPLVDAEFVDKVVDFYLNSDPPCDYASSTSSYAYPIGLSVEVFAFSVLEAAWKEDTDTRRREHVTPFIVQQPNRFHIRHLHSSRDYSYIRWTVDTIEDLSLVRKIFEHFGDTSFSWLDALALIEKNPKWLEINRNIKQKPIL